MTKHPSTHTALFKRAATAVDITTGRPHDKAAPNARSYVIGRRGRFWEVLDASGTLVCLTVYKRGAVEVVRRLSV
jgi:hypothetical protein